MNCAWMLAGCLAMAPVPAAERDGAIVASAPCAARPQQSYAEYVKDVDVLRKVVDTPGRKAPVS